jgi:hypothetical protein
MLRRLVASALASLSFFGLATTATAQPAAVTSELERDVAPNSSATCPTPAAYRTTRPDPAGVPTRIGVGVFLQDVAQFNDIDQTLDVDAYVVLRWRDGRLADPARGDGSADCPVPTGMLWLPLLEPEFLRNRQSFYAERFLVDNQGVVTLVRRILAKVAYPLDFRDFPMDRHSWRLTLWPVEARSEEMTLQPLPRFTGIVERVTMQGWHVGGLRAETSTAARLQRTGTYARFDLVLDLERDWQYYAWKFGLPLVLVTLMAYGVYFVPPTAVPQQIGLSTTAMLTLIAYMLTLGNTLPRIAYLTRADRFFAGSALLVFLGLVKAVATLALADSPHAAFIPRVDRWARWIYPLAILANFVLAFLV